MQKSSLHNIPIHFGKYKSEFVKMEMINSGLQAVRYIQFCGFQWISCAKFQNIKEFKMNKLLFVVILSIFYVSVQCVSAVDSIWCWKIFQFAVTSNIEINMFGLLIGLIRGNDETNHWYGPTSVPTKVQSYRWWMFNENTVTSVGIIYWYRFFLNHRANDGR